MNGCSRTQLRLLSLALAGLAAVACSADRTEPPAEAAPGAGLETTKVTAPLAVAWSWQEQDGPAPLLRVEVTPHQPVRNLTVELGGPAGLSLAPAAPARSPVGAAGVAVIHEVRCQGRAAGDGLDLWVSAEVEGLAMGRALRVPLPAGLAGPAGDAPSAGELVQDPDGQWRRVLPATVTTGRR